MIVVVGAGIAGLSAALAVAGGNETSELDSGQPIEDVLLISKANFTMSNTYCAQGGIAAAIAETDSPALHMHDTLLAGDGLCDEEAVRILTTEGAHAVRALAQGVVHFDRDASGQLQHGMEGAHSVPRILHAGGDATGYVMEVDLAAVAAANPRIHILEYAFLEDLCIRNGAVHGLKVRIDPDAVTSPLLQRAYEARNSDSIVDALRERSAVAPGHLIEIASNSVILATGGAGQVYEYTTNPEIATGDGVAAAWRAGARIQDAEFYQFHPTALASHRHFLVSEAVRGEGAVLLDAQGKRYMPTIDPRAELAPRDIVARANFRTMMDQDGEPVRLDVTVLARKHPHLADFLKRRFPTLDNFTTKEGFDWSHEAIPVTPAAHYWMGGIHTDLWGRTTIRGLYAAGECARTGVHGANRLASNSLLEGLVFGKRAGATAIADRIRGIAPAHEAAGQVDCRPSQVAKTKGGRIPSRVEIQKLMWTKVGVIRREADLQYAVKTLSSWLHAMNDAYDQRDMPGSNAKDCVLDRSFLEDRNLVTVGYVIAQAALNRPESLGAHTRA
ncbi:L-aspartate oxidase [Bifidobacterium aquikefiri]|uniref:L-aspartate oxidase n=1 Tax=Bifidobacterium aquikefiri TaxID=1653207 RepID=A0A261G3Y7_9BIFI|nr:FAD-binding protein [Bifidobacterium aquikefiri]OZG66118.1 L-aspartate oxidase [Bifidobacterium aquikefiri]